MAFIRDWISLLSQCYMVSKLTCEIFLSPMDNCHFSRHLFFSFLESNMKTLLVFIAVIGYSVFCRDVFLS